MRVHRDDYRPPGFLVDQVTLVFDLDPATTRVYSRLQMRRNPEHPEPGMPLRLDGKRLALQDLTLNGLPPPDTAWTQDETGLTIPDVPDRFTLTTDVVINPSANTALLGLYSAGSVLCTQCEPEAFRRITFFPDRPDVLARFRVTLRADPARYPVMLANGNPGVIEGLPDGRHQLTWDDPFPKPCYLFALVAGDLQRAETVFTTASGREVPIRLYVEPHNIDCCEHALSTVRRAMTWDERRYGREYDLDVFNLVAVSAYTMGAMENKGLNIFNDRYVLAHPDSATDADLRAIEALVAHEYFHNWTGNRITCRDWFQLGLKEGLTVFREQQFVEDQGWGAVRRLEDVRLMRSRQFAEDAGPMAHPVRPEAYQEIENFFTDTVYSKGAEVVRMLATLLGPPTFLAGMNRYFRVHDGRAVTIEAFVDTMAEVSGRDLRQFMGWYDRRGTPVVMVYPAHDPERQEYRLNVVQVPAEGTEPLHIPLAVGFLDRDGQEMPMQLDGESAPTQGTRLLELRKRRHTFRFIGVSDPPTPALLRRFSAPVRIRFAYDETQLRRLATSDPDAVVRWDAVQRLVEQAVSRRLRGSESPPETLITVFESLLQRHAEAPGLTAELLTLADDRTVAEALTVTDLDALFDARKWLAATLGQRLMKPLLAAYNDCRPEGPFVYGPDPTGRRALKNLCLSYVLDSESEGAVNLCHRQYVTAGNMTDRIAALALLAQTTAPERDQALADFRKHWWDSPLMVDKWLAVQARSRRPDTLDQVLALMDDRVFSLDQPNRVRSLIEVFCAGNPAQFHRLDGTGYRFLADQVLDLDPVNPQLAAHLARYLADNRWVDNRRRAAMHTELERIRETQALSGGTREVTAAGLALSPDPLDCSN